MFKALIHARYFLFIFSDLLEQCILLLIELLCKLKLFIIRLFGNLMHFLLLLQGELEFDFLAICISKLIFQLRDLLLRVKQLVLQRIDDFLLSLCVRVFRLIVAPEFVENSFRNVAHRIISLVPALMK